MLHERQIMYNVIKFVICLILPLIVPLVLLKVDAYSGTYKYAKTQAVTYG